MSRQNKESLTRQIQVNLDNKLCIGQSKHQDKINSIDRSNNIYSWGTYRSYIRECNHFANFCKENFKSKTLEDCKTHANEWIESRQKQGLSNYTLKLDVSALGKLYSCSSTDFTKIPVRNRVEITRSRGDAVRDKHFSMDKNKSLVRFCKSTGLRRGELQVLTGDKLIQKGNDFFVKIDRGSKGGRMRVSKVIGSAEDIKHVVDLMHDAGTQRVFEKIHNGADIHSFRADYAKAFYDEIARNIKDIPFDKVNSFNGLKYQSEVYKCRGDLAGKQYDKVAMLEVSRNLGHNRIEVIASHYLYDEEII